MLENVTFCIKTIHRPMSCAALVRSIYEHCGNDRPLIHVLDDGRPDLCYVGVWLMYSQERHYTCDANTTTGIILVMGAALSYSIYVLFAKPTMQAIGSREFTSLAMMGSTVFVAIQFVATRPLASFFQSNPSVFLYGAVLAIGCTVIPSYLINEAIVRIGATRTSVIGSAGPVLTMLLAILLLKEPSTPYHFIGMFIAIVGVALVAKK